MCGVGGVVGEVSENETGRAIHAMAASLAHRGPDDSGTAIIGAPPVLAGLCATRLAIRDPGPNGHQPMSSPRTGSIIVFNGEIYNLDELRAALSGAGVRLTGHCDTEVVLACYDRWGPECLQRLRGMFALGIWDAPGRRLFLARDRLGIKPLYYRATPTGLAFASEVRSLLAAGRASARLDPTGLTSYLLLGGVEEPGTVLAEVRALPAGHAAIWTEAGLKSWRYWSLREAFEHSAPRRPTDELRAELRDRLADAVSSHLVSDVPLGVFLSGGIDSSAVVALAAAGGPRLRTVSLVFGEQRFSEARYIDEIVAQYRTEHVELQVTPQDVLRQLPAALAAMDQPTVDGINSFLVSGVARESGLTVALSGLGGDELFAGYDTFRRVPRLERAQQLIPAPVGRGLAAIARPALGPAGGAKLSRWLAGRDAPESAHELVRELFSPAARHALVPGAEVSRDLRHLETPADPTDAVSFLELERYTRNVLLRDTDVMSMARGLEVRVPLLDDRLVSWVAGLPGELKRSGSGPKPLLTGALEGMLPRAVVQRKKMGFTLPFALWLHGELRATVERALLDSDCGGAAAAALNGAAVADVWRQFQAGRAHWSRPWSLYVLKMWGEANTVR